MFEEYMVPMRDGIELYTRVWKPTGGGKYPVVLERGYWPGMDASVTTQYKMPDHSVEFPQAGYIYVGQKTRGSLEGGMFFPDAKDGYDCLDWISRQPWCDGNIGMYGRSFMGATQWLTAPERHPNLKAIVPQCVNVNFWERGYWDHGALQLAHVARRIYKTETADYSDRVEAFGGWEKFYRHLPLITLDETTVGVANRLWKEYVAHSHYDYYWSRLQVHYEAINIPVFIHGGWYDNYAAAAFNQYSALRPGHRPGELRLAVNPTQHNNVVVGDRDFGPTVAKDEIALACRWFDRWLKGLDNGLDSEPPISIFVMGENVWRAEDAWPLTRTQFTPYYFHSDGGKDGWLSPKPPGDERPTQYTYDPDDPVPSLGGNHSSPEYQPHILRVGTMDQRPNESRPDVLVFTSEPVEHNVEVTGPVLVKLYAASTAPDTDFVVKLIDVDPDGTAWNLTGGIIRARFRESIYQPPSLIQPGRDYEYTIELLPTSNVFKRGHRIRLHVTSSDFPLYDRNPNTGHEQGMSAEIQRAEQTIYHDSARPSHVVLPIIPR
ncbi:MAG: CocE/NonD family hydrolase [Chloroflexi bacterium]|nr:CocE/NonD family hydrolase [Chloroflexota bacterium]